MATSSDVQLQSEAERFVEALQAEGDGEADTTDKSALQRQYRECTDKVLPSVQCMQSLCYDQPKDCCHQPGTSWMMLISGKQVEALQASIDEAYRDCFAGVEFEAAPEEEAGAASDGAQRLSDVSEASFSELGRTQPKASAACSILKMLCTLSHSNATCCFSGSIAGLVWCFLSLHGSSFAAACWY